MAKVIEVEIDAPRNRNLYFVPLSRKIRGTFKWDRVADKNSAQLRETWPDIIPGQRIGVNLDDRSGYVVEPLHDQPDLRKRIEGRGLALPPREENFQRVNTQEWTFYMRNAVIAGKAHVVKGTLPETVDFTPRRYGQADNRRDKLADALIAVLYGQLNESAKKEVAALVGA